MGKISFRNNGEDHNFWQNYTDLMSGFLIVFIIASIVAYSSYKIYVDLYHEKGITETNINDIIVNAELYKKIKEFQDAQKSLQSDYFRYNSTYDRFECTVDVQFETDSDVIPQKSYNDLILAGQQLEDIIKMFQKSTNISFKIIIDGRAAKHNDQLKNETYWRFTEVLSYKRARNLYNFWQSKGILEDLEKLNGEVFISGSGFGGQGRYVGAEEGRNKTFIVQIIPYIKYE